MFTRQDLAVRHAKTLRRHRRARTRVGRALVASAIAAGAVSATGIVAQSAIGSPRAPAVTFTRLTLVNGWHTYPGAARPAVADISGIVTFKGDIGTSGTNPVPFTLPKAFRPATDVYVTSALCSANKGRLHITPAGVVTVQSEGAFSNAACVTSLDGVSFAQSAASFTNLKLQNGWQNAPFHTSAAAVRLIAGIVHFKGAIWTKGSSSIPFTLPKGLRPAAVVYIPVDLCDANKGRLYILPDGVVHVYAELRASDAACFTSLDGATFAASAKSFTALKLQNGWRSYGQGTYKPAVRMTSGIVQFEGAIRTSGSPFDVALFTLPTGMRPANLVYVEVDLCSQNNGRLYIQPNGVVEVYAEGGARSHAQCFTSLDGAWFTR